MYTIYHLDENPIEMDGFWVFKNLEEPRESIRRNQISLNAFRPFVIVNQLTKKVNEINWKEYQNIKSNNL